MATYTAPTWANNTSPAISAANLQSLSDFCAAIATYIPLTAWTPTIASGTGSITSYTASGNYSRIGKLVVCSFIFTITNNGTGATSITISGLPYQVGGISGSGAARESDVSGKLCSITAVTGTSTAVVFFYDNTYPGATNAKIAGTFSYHVS